MITKEAAADMISKSISEARKGIEESVRQFAEQNGWKLNDDVHTHIKADYIMAWKDIEFYLRHIIKTGD